MVQRISLDPDPPIRGQSVTITYDFSGTNLDETRLRVSFDPTGVPDTYTVTTSNPSVSVQVPSDAESILVEDLDGDSDDKSAFCEDPPGL